jgi:class 3 adenylate cyclase
MSRASGRVLAAALFTDIVNSTAIAEELGDRRWKAVITRHHQIVRRQLKRFGGTEQDTAGDGFFATFPEPASAIGCACTVSNEVRDLGIQIRTGVHFGECERVGKKLSGITVVVAARIMALGGAGDVLVSRTAAELARGAGFGFEDRGEHTLKGVEDPFQVMAVITWEDEARPAPLDPEEARARRAAVEDVPTGRRPRIPVVVAAVVGLVLLAAAGAFALTRGSDAVTPAPGDLARIAADGGSFDEIAPLGAQAFPQSIASGGGTLWVASVGNQTLAAVDPADASAQVLGTPGTPTGIAFGGDLVWVTFGFESAPNQRPRGARPDERRRARPAPFVAPAGSYPIASDGRRIWVADPLGSTVARYEPVSDATTTIRSRRDRAGRDRPRRIAGGGVDRGRPRADGLPARRDRRASEGGAVSAPARTCPPRSPSPLTGPCGS